MSKSGRRRGARRSKRKIKILIELFIGAEKRDAERRVKNEMSRVN
jgi:hypothetical protein